MCACHQIVAPLPLEASVTHRSGLCYQGAFLKKPSLHTSDSRALHKLDHGREEAAQAKRCTRFFYYNAISTSTSFSAKSKVPVPATKMEKGPFRLGPFFIFIVSRRERSVLLRGGSVHPETPSGFRTGSPLLERALTVLWAPFFCLPLRMSCLLVFK